MSLRVSTKLPLILLGGAIVVGSGIGVASYFTAKSTMEAISQEHLEASAQNGRDQFQSYLASI
ncbi:MAG: hypothetical protein AAF590_11465 [Pseudomonadota bacterium]